MGFMASAFAGGLAKGYLQGKEQRRQAAIAERELKIKEENLALSRQIMEKDQQNNNLTMQLETRDQFLDQMSDEGLVRAGSGLRFTAAGDADSSAYYHFSPVKGKDDKLDYEKTNFLNLQRLNSEIQGPNGAAIKQAIIENPDAWAKLVTQYYDGTSKFQSGLEDGELMRMYMLRLSPLSAEEMKTKTTRDMSIFNPLLENFKDLGTAYGNKSLTDYIKERNQLQLQNAHKKSDGSYAYYKHKDGKVSLIKKDAKTIGGVPINKEQINSLNTIGVIDFSNSKNKSFNHIISVSQALDQLKEVSPAARAGASVLFMEEDLGFDLVADQGSAVSANSLAMKKLYDNTKLMFSESSGNEEDHGYIPLGIREQMTDAATLAFYTKNLAKDAIVVDSTNNLTTARVKNTFIQGKASKPVITNATATITTATSGIENVHYILDLQAGIPIEFLKSGQIGSGGFDLLFRLGKGFQNVTELFGSDLFKSGLNINDQNMVKGKLAEVDSEINTLREGGFDSSAVSGQLAETLSKAENDYSQNVSDLIRSQKRGDFLTAAKGDKALASKIFEARMEIEAQKIRLAFRLASIVQGGGSGGGRTISNADFEVIYNSLYKSGTGQTLTNALLRVRHELLKSKVRAKNILNYGGMGVHTQVSAFSDAYLDRAYSEANGLMRNGQAYVYDSTASPEERSQDIMATTAMTKQQTTLADANVSTMTDQGINLFGLNKESDQFKELSSLSTQIDFNSTDEEVKQKNLQYANLVIDYLLPSFSATTFDKNRYASSEEDQLSSVFRNFSEAGDLESLRNKLREGQGGYGRELENINKTLVKGISYGFDRNFNVIGPNIPTDKAQGMVDEFMYNRGTKASGVNEEFLNILYNRIQQEIGTVD